LATRPDGSSLTFAIDDVAPGEYLLRARGAEVKSVIWNGRDYTKRPLTVTAGADVMGIVITTTTQTAMLRGTVHDTDGRPASDATVVCFPADPAAWRRTGLSSPRVKVLQTSVNVAQDSIFMQSLPAGEYYVLAVSEPLPRSWQDPAFLTKAAAVATRVTLEWGDKPSIDLTAVALPR
jgi:hypothetical protein